MFHFLWDKNLNKIKLMHLKSFCCFSLLYFLFIICIRGRFSYAACMISVNVLKSTPVAGRGSDWMCLICTYFRYSANDGMIGRQAGVWVPAEGWGRPQLSKKDNCNFTHFTNSRLYHTFKFITHFLHIIRSNVWDKRDTRFQVVLYSRDAASCVDWQSAAEHRST